MKQFLLSILFLFTINIISAKPTYILVFGDGEERQFSTTDKIDRISYSEENGQWKMLLWCGNESVTVSVVENDMPVVSSAPAAIVYQEINDNQIVWITPVGIFVKTFPHLVDSNVSDFESVDSLLLFTSFDNEIACDVSYMDGFFNLVCKTENAVIRYLEYVYF